MEIVALYDIGRMLASESTDFESFLATLSRNNGELFTEPLPLAEVERMAKKLWEYRQTGRLHVPGGANDQLVPLYKYPNAWALWDCLCRHHGPTHVFAVSPQGLAGVLPFSDKTIAKSRDVLVSNGFLELTHKGCGRGDPNLYRFGLGAGRTQSRAA